MGKKKVKEERKGNSGKKEMVGKGVR